MNFAFLTTAPTAVDGGWMATLISFSPIVLMLILFYFFWCVRNRKRKTTQMRNSIEVGDGHQYFLILILSFLFQNKPYSVKYGKKLG